MDPLSDVFAAMRLSAAVSTRLEATAPWAWRAAPGDGSRVTFVLVLEGSGYLAVGGGAPGVLAAGDVCVIFDSEPYMMADSLATPAVDCTVVEAGRVGSRIAFGGGGARTVFLSGSFAIDPLDARPILSVLPPALHLPASSLRCRAVEALLNLLEMESLQPGLASDATVTRLYELLFVHAVRAYAREGGGDAGGWLAAISDRQLAPAAAAMHGRPEANWTLATLAAQAAMSRSAFAARFHAVVGQAPMAYLTGWRVHRARRLLRQGGQSLAQVAQAVGYESESAFNRVFKRVTGQTPGEFRRFQGASVRKHANA